MSARQESLESHTVLEQPRNKMLLLAQPFISEANTKALDSHTDFRAILSHGNFSAYVQIMYMNAYTFGV